MESDLSVFSKWMRQVTGLWNSSIYKYTRAINSISNDMQAIGVIEKPLMEMNLIELDLAVVLIPSFRMRSKLSDLHRQQSTSSRGGL